ncbi:MAG: 16S rRNA (guanine(966)-N(2))-methyltransferase RsmD [Candidatus Latescibacteria bacterium]|nr:16S rRNA (guanine(966)-N(2))-methyltransferase RsmD [Candidatus Latescibacterota bacterium]
MIRIIGGMFRGRKLRTPKGLATRPVLGRIREALFNVIGDIGNYRVLDLYSGTGAIGIEALSRGAQSAVFVDSGFRQCTIIRQNLSDLNISEEVIKSDVIRTIVKLDKSNRQFDFIFADPPYEKGLGLETLETVSEKNILAEKGILALTVRSSEEFPKLSGHFEQIFNRLYGDTRLILYMRKKV